MVDEYTTVGRPTGVRFALWATMYSVEDPAQPLLIRAAGVAVGAAAPDDWDVYVASKPAPFTDPSDVNVTYS